MNYSQIICLSDLLREPSYTPEAIFDMVKEPIRQGTGKDIWFSFGEDFIHPYMQEFQLDTFRNLAGMCTDSGLRAQWKAIYYKVPKDAIEYLFNYISKDTLILAFEMPPWLIKACNERGYVFIDIRISPLRFGRDLYIGISCNSKELTERISSFSVLDEELRLEASTLSANVRLHQRRLADERGYNFDSLKDSVVFVGQLPYDASLLDEKGYSLRCIDFAEQLKKLCNKKRLFYKAHPLALEYAEEERKQLASITGYQVLPCNLNAYQVLGSSDNVELVGISSSMLQEAEWFNKKAHILYKPFVSLFSKGKSFESSYKQIHFQTFLSPEFWHSTLTPERAVPNLAKLTPVAHNHARETLDYWWDYSKILTWERTLPYESFMRSSGAEFRSRITQLENKINILSTSSLSYSINESKDDRLKLDLLISLYSRLASDYQCSEDVFSKNKSPAIYINKNLNAEYYQELHDKNILFKSNNWLMPYLELIADKKYRIVREIGCGNGAFSSAIAKSVDKVIGLDWAKSPDFPEAFNIVFEQKDITKADLEAVDLNCSADVLEHIEPEKLPLLIKSLNESSKANFHVIACYDDGHSHLSIFPPDAWLFLFKQVDPNYRILDISIRHDDISNIVCVVSNI